MVPLARCLAVACAAVLGLGALAAARLPAVAQDVRISPSPEGATGWFSRPLAVAETQMVVAANPLAAEAGREVLRAGGSAADAAIAVQLVLNLVEPQSSGIGGGAFALYWAAGGELKTYDGREAAPAAARPDRFLVDGVPRKLDDAIFGGLSVGVPGTLRLLEALHKQHGRLPWPQLFAPAIRLATEGFRVSPRLHGLLRAYGAEVFSPAARQYFFDATGSPRPAGHLLRNPEFAATLRAIAEGGADAFYAGALAQTMVDAVRTAPGHAGDLTLADLAAYRIKERPPVCFTYRTAKICGMGPPSSGGLAVAQVLKLLEPYDLGKAPATAMGAPALHLIAEAEKLAFADRNHFIADPDVVPAPAGLLNAGYLDTRRALINPAAAMARAAPGSPPQTSAAAYGTDATVEQSGTSHISIVDRNGNAISMTTTIESGFGSRLWVGGFLLNNELTDFSFRPVDTAGRPIANAVGPGKRPRSSMAPTIVFDAGGRLRAVLGSPGGSLIIPYVVKTLIALLDWQLDAQAAAALTNFGSRGGPFEVEVDQPRAIWHALLMKSLGHSIRADVMTSGTHVIVIDKDGKLQGGADPRREGEALGD